MKAPVAISKDGFTARWRPPKQPEPGDPKIAVALIRVSKSSQELGPEAQKIEIQKWATAGGIQVVTWHSEEISGLADVSQRPGLIAALTDLRPHNAGWLVVAKRDRLARCVRAAAIIDNTARGSGAKVVCANGECDDDGSPESDLMRTIVDAIAAYERARIAIRTKEALGVKKIRGELVGSMPYGKKLGADGKTLDDDPVEMEVVRFVNDGIRDGRSLMDVRAELVSVGKLTRTGREFKINQLRRMLSSELAGQLAQATREALGRQTKSVPHFSDVPAAA